MIDLSHLGDLQPDGTIRLFDKNREYRRIRQTPEQRLYLTNAGYTVVNSSNVSALMRQGNDLYIRFLNSSIYVYPNSGDLFDKILSSNSKGHAVWVYLRRARKEYRKVGSMPYPKDLQNENDLALAQITDAQTFQSIDVEFIMNMARNVEAIIKNEVISINGVNVVPVIVGNETIYIPLNLIIAQN